MCFILSDLKCYRNTSWNSKIIFEVQRKMSNEKITRRKISFPTYKTCFFSFFFPPLWAPLIFKPHNFFSFILNDLKRYVNTTWSSKNHLWTLITIKQHTNNFVGVWEPVFVAFGGLFFWVFDPLYFEGP
jgi:hypothetical protein